MKVPNTFSGGIDKDSNNSLPRKNTYLDAQNLRLNTDDEQSEAALQNVKGNYPFGTIPNTSIVYKVVAGTMVAATNSTFSITINASTFNSSPTAYTETLENIVDLINDNFSAVINAYLAPDESYMLLTSTDGTAITTFTITVSSGNAPTISTYIAAQTTLIPIGWTTIRDEVIVLTTSETSQSPTTGIGQIWKITYDEITLAETFTLLYNNIINFTTFHPVSPLAITSRYENSTTKRIYWTDNYNELRSFNTADVDGFILDTTLLDVEVAVDGSIPILQTVTSGGSTLVGMYQAAFRLKNDTSVTTFSELSNPVFTVEKSEQEVVAALESDEYVGANLGTTAGKTITWKINGLDTDFDRIEVVILFYDSYNGSPIVRITHDEPIPDNGIFSFSYSGSELLEEITINAFLLQTFSFTHCKTITHKDNRLIVANVRNTVTDFDFDARAYRFSTSSSAEYITVETSQGSSNSYSTYTLVPETHDAITPSSSYQYQLGTGILGGTGANIQYGFGTFVVKGDSTTELSATGISPFALTAPRYNSGVENLGVTDQDYPTNGINDGIKYAYRSGLLKGYQRNETYRFGIVFYDTQARPLFARWVGDIKMPDYNDVNSNPDDVASAAGITDFRLSFPGTATLDGGTNCNWLQILYPIFTVTIPTAIKQFIGGYRIIRVDRTKDDKTILGAGLVTQMVEFAGAFLANPSHHASNSDNPTVDLNISTYAGANGDFPLRQFTYDSPDFLLAGYTGRQSGDYLVPSITFGRAAAQTVVDTIPASATEPYRISKYYATYAFNPFNTTAYPIEEGGEVGYNGSFNFTSGFPFYNYSMSSTAARLPSIGTKTVALRLGADLNTAATFLCTEASYRRIYALYYRTVTAQYGGNTYSARSRNEYIPCGSFQPVLASDSTSSFVHQVFGGDIYLDIYDHQKLVKNNTTLSGRSDSTGVGVSKNSFSYFFPCECSHNMNLRHGIHINKDLYKNLGEDGEPGVGELAGASFYETYDYNLVYSSNNIGRTYITKPLDFLAIEEHDTRIWVSEEKQDGESKDSWKQFLPANYYDAENYHGPINALLLFKDKVFFLQDTAFGVVPINDRTLIAPTNGGETSLGTPLEIIQRPEYISQTVGCKHQWGITTSDTAIYFFDINSKQLFQFSQSLVPIPGLSGYFKTNLVGTVLTTDNPVYITSSVPKAGINCTTDFKNHDVLFTFFDFTQDPTGISGTGTTRKFTIAYNEKFKCFTSFLSFWPSLYINNRKVIITPYADNQLYIHEYGNRSSFYGTVYDSSVKVLVNPDANTSKMFTNLEWLTQSINSSDVNILTDTWHEARMYNDYQNTDTKTLTVGTNIRRTERGWRYAIPRNAVKATGGSTLDIFSPANLNPLRLFKEPIRDMYMTVDLTYDNTNNYKLICPFIVTDYLVSPR